MSYNHNGAQTPSGSIYEGTLDNESVLNPFSTVGRTELDLNYYQYANVNEDKDVQKDQLKVPYGREPTYPAQARSPNLSRNGEEDGELINTYTNNSENISMISYEGATGYDLEGESKNNNSLNIFNRYTRGSKIFLGISICCAALVLFLELYMYAVMDKYRLGLENARFQEISIYLSLFIFASIYQVGLTIFGLYTKNMLLLTLLCVFYVCMLIYTGIQYLEVSQNISIALTGGWRTATKATNLATIVVLAFTLISQVYLIFFVLRKEVSWFQYKKIGGDMKIRKLYRYFLIHRSLLIFDFFFFIGFTVQFLVIMVSKRTSVEFILTVCVLPLTLILLFFSDLATTREWIWLSATTTLTFLGGCAYVIFKMVRMYTKYDSAYNTGVQPGESFPGRKSLVTFGVITLLLLVTTIIIEIMMVFNYNKGLLPIVSRSWKWFPGNSSTKVPYKATHDANLNLKGRSNHSYGGDTSMDHLDLNGLAKQRQEDDENYDLID